MRLATEEDLLRDFPEGFMIGVPVRPKPAEQQGDDAEERDVDDES